MSLKNQFKADILYPGHSQERLLVNIFNGRMNELFTFKSHLPEDYNDMMTRPEAEEFLRDQVMDDYHNRIEVHANHTAYLTIDAPMHMGYGEWVSEAELTELGKRAMVTLKSGYAWRTSPGNEGEDIDASIQFYMTKLLRPEVDMIDISIGLRMYKKDKRFKPLQKQIAYVLMRGKKDFGLVRLEPTSVE